MAFHRAQSRKGRVPAGTQAASGGTADTGDSLDKLFVAKYEGCA